MSAKALTKKYGSRAMGLSKRVKAGQVVTKAKKGKFESLKRRGSFADRQTDYDPTKMKDAIKISREVKGTP